mmetsp:Transcript_17227/g.42327  ORF Transcript_17227/g.42327 Transcript_17227/m.42327 type:complete len:143 (-) Transcript_17227:64-492(-)
MATRALPSAPAAAAPPPDAAPAADSPYSDIPERPSQSDWTSQPFWHPNLTRVSAEAHLRGQCKGAFVLRPSSMPGCLSLSHVEDDSGKVGHAVVKTHTGPERVGYSIGDSTRTHVSLLHLIAYLPTLNHGLYPQVPFPEVRD